MHTYAAQVLEDFAQTFKGYQRQPQSQGKQQTADFSIGEIRFTVPEWLRSTIAEGVATAPLTYVDPQGIGTLREAYASQLQRQGFSIGTGNILITTGAKEALWLALVFALKAGARLLLPKPGWTPYFVWARALGTEIVSYDPLSKTLVNDLLTCLSSQRPSVALLNFPHNPTGIELTTSEMDRIYEAAGAAGTLLISDEVYRSFAVSSQVGSVLRYTQSAPSRVIHVDSVSKSLALAGLRIGFLVADEQTIARLTTLRSSIASCVSSVTQTGILAVLQDVRGEQWMQMIVDKSRQCLHLAVSQLEQRGAEIVSSGAIYIWLRQLSTPSDSILVDTMSIKGTPGESFGTPGYLRLCPTRTDELLHAVFPALPLKERSHIYDC